MTVIRAGIKTAPTPDWCMGAVGQSPSLNKPRPLKTNEKSTEKMCVCVGGYESVEKVTCSNANAITSPPLYRNVEEHVLVRTLTSPPAL